MRNADRAPVLEPYMFALVSAPARYLSTVRKDLLGRPGRITRLIARGSSMPGGEAPLAKLLGPQRLHHTWDSAVSAYQAMPLFMRILSSRRSLQLLYRSANASHEKASSSG